MFLDVRGKGVLDLTHKHVLKDRRCDINRPHDLEHAVDVLLSIGHENGVCALKHLEETFRSLEALKSLLRLIHGNVLEHDHLAYDAPFFRKVALIVHPERDAVRTDGFAGKRPKELIASRLEHHAIHRESHFNGFEIFLL